METRPFAFWASVIEKIERRLHTWKNSYISEGGRLTLIQATLSNTHIHYISLISKPNKVTLPLVENIFGNFLGRGSTDHSSMHHVKWDKIFLPTEQGGLGIQSMRDKDRALLAKWVWRYQAQKSALWRRVSDAKFGPNSLQIRPGSTSLKTARGPWKSI